MAREKVVDTLVFPTTTEDKTAVSCASCEPSRGDHELLELVFMGTTSYTNYFISLHGDHELHEFFVMGYVNQFS